MKRKIGIIFILAGAALLLAALSLLLWNLNEDKKAGVSVEKILPQVIAEIDGSVLPDPFDTTMTEAEVDGHSYIGYLSVPTLGLELPVMADWSYPQLKISPCRYTGSAKSDDLVIAAHNYTHHFGNIKNLMVGDAVYFTDMEGAVFAYEVAELEVLGPAAVEEMTSNDYALTLFTCTYGGSSRVTVRCRRANETE